MLRRQMLTPETTGQTRDEIIADLLARHSEGPSRDFVAAFARDNPHAYPVLVTPMEHGHIMGFTDIEWTFIGGAPDGR